MYYQASPALVGESMRHLMRDVSWGWLMQGIHRWSSHGMVVLCLLQLLRFVANGAYRGKRAGHWFVGLLMAGLIVSLAFSGRFLVWDEQAYWQMTSVLGGIESVPGIGHGLATILRGGAEVTATTLSRAWATHVLLLPWTLTLLLGLNLWFLGKRRGGRP
jgi:quinol-cytochrome oxidoreductase complex cytochrome b subunit